MPPCGPRRNERNGKNIVLSRFAKDKVKIYISRSDAANATEKQIFYGCAG